MGCFRSHRTEMGAEPWGPAVLCPESLLQEAWAHRARWLLTRVLTAHHPTGHRAPCTPRPPACRRGAPARAPGGSPRSGKSSVNGPRLGSTWQVRERHVQHVLRSFGHDVSERLRPDQQSRLPPWAWGTCGGSGRRACGGFGTRWACFRLTGDQVRFLTRLTSAPCSSGPRPHRDGQPPPPPQPPDPPGRRKRRCGGTAGITGGGGGQTQPGPPRGGVPRPRADLGRGRHPVLCLPWRRTASTRPLAQAQVGGRVWCVPGSRGAVSPRRGFLTGEGRAGPAEQHRRGDPQPTTSVSV